MKRVQLFEFEDFSWFPSWMRSCMTRQIVVLLRFMGGQEVVKDLLTSIRERHSFDRIVDVGSGAGGMMPDVVRSLNEEHPDTPIDLLLTDLYPNNDLIDQLEALEDPHISYRREPLNAMEMQTSPSGLKTMLNSFHHMPPPKARAILQSAYESRQPFLIYEMAENNVPLLLFWLTLPIAFVLIFLTNLVLTLFIRPLTFRQIVFTYVIPIIPFCYAWDGLASNPRMYAFSDFDELLADHTDDEYTWTVQQAPKPSGGTIGYYVLGLPSALHGS